jgi:hypothetical protein
VRKRLFGETSDPAQRRRLLVEAQAHIDSLLEIVGRRKAELESFEAELNERRQRVAHLLREPVV